MASSFVNVMIIYFCVSAALFIGGVEVIGGDVNDIVDRFVDINETTGQIVTSPGFEASVGTDFDSAGSEVLQFVDSIRAVVTFLKFIVNILFAPIGLFTSTGVPWQVNLLVAAPMMIAIVMGFVYLVRAGN